MPGNDVAPTEEQQPYEQLFLELTSAVTGEPEEQAILAKSMPIYLRRLNCVLVGVLKNEESHLKVHEVLPFAFRDDGIWTVLQSKLLTLEDEQLHSAELNTIHTYCYRIHEYGWFVLGRRKPLTNYLKNELRAVIEHLGKALYLSQEILRRKEGEEKLSEVSETLRSVINAMPDLILRINHNLRFTYFHTNRPEDLIVPEEVLVGSNVHDVLPPHLAKKLAKSVATVLAENNVAIIEYDLTYEQQKKWFEARISQVNNAEVLCVVRNITDRKENERLLQLKERMLLAIANSTNALLSNQDIFSAVDLSLRELGEASGVDRTYLFTAFTRNGELRVSHQLEWCAPDIQPEIDNPELKDCPAFVEFKKDDEPFNEVIRLMPDEHPLKPVLESQGIRSILIIPIWFNDAFWGFVGFDDCTSERKWTAAELSLLRSFSSSISSALYRQYDAQQLEASKNEAERASSAKSQFLANMSHEIRTPLNSIIGFTELLKTSTLNPQQRQQIEAVHSSSRVLLDTVNDILDLSKIEAGKLDLNEEPTDLETVCDELKRIFSVLTTEKGLDFIITFDPYIPKQLVFDPMRLRQVLINLIGNAVKFTHKGNVTLNVACVLKNDKTTTIRFTVSDTGVGIGTEQQQHILVAFNQADNKITRKYGGTGLGLTISNHIIGLMGGELEIESVINKGSTFSFALHLAIAHEQALTTTDHEASSDEQATMQILFQKPFNLVAIDDGHLNLVLIEAVIKSLLPNARIGCFASGDDYLKALPESPPDLIFMDIQMPGLSGYQVTEQLRTMAPYTTVPIYALTAGAITGESTRCLAAGMNGYLRKPLEVPQLKKVLFDALRSAHTS